MFWAWDTSRVKKVCTLPVNVTLLHRIAEIPFWVDIEQMQSFMDEYEHSSQKEKLLGDKQEKLVAIRGVC